MYVIVNTYPIFVRVCNLGMLFMLRFNYIAIYEEPFDCVPFLTTQEWKRLKEDYGTKCTS